MHRVAAITDKHTLNWRSSDAELNPDAVRLSASLTGISAGTEGMWYMGTAPALVSGRRGYPYSPGYEFVGMVEAIGTGVLKEPGSYPRLSSLSVGDRVFAFKPHGSFADITESDLWVALPETVSDEDALGLALSCTCLHALHRAGHGVGDHAAVLGLGVVGMIMIQMLKAAGAGRIVASTRSAEKEALARMLGADEICDATADNVTLPTCETVYECSGTAAGVFASTRLATNQARIAGVGFYTEDIRLSGEEVFAKELAFFGVRASGAAGARSEFVRWPRTENLKLAATYLEAGKLTMAPLISHRFSPDELASAYDIIASKSQPYMLMVLDWKR